MSPEELVTTFLSKNKTNHIRMNTSSFVCVLCKFGNEKIQICANSKILEMHTTDTKKRRTAEFLLPHNISQGCAMRVCGNKNIFKKKEKSLKNIYSVFRTLK